MKVKEEEERLKVSLESSQGENFVSLYLYEWITWVVRKEKDTTKYKKERPQHFLQEKI